MDYRNYKNMENLVRFEDPHFIADLIYAKSNNMLSCAVYEDVGFGNHIYMHKDVADKLMSLVSELDKIDCKMRICDAYRPPIAHMKCVEVVSIKGFFKPDYTTSNHCHGTAIDVCLTDVWGNNLIYPTEVDAYTPEFARQVANGKFDEFQKHLIKARHDYSDSSQEAMKNREFLKKLMESHGFESIPHEWWHYNLKGWENYPVVEWGINNDTQKR